MYDMYQIDGSLRGPKCRRILNQYQSIQKLNGNVTFLALSNALFPHTYGLFRAIVSNRAFNRRSEMLMRSLSNLYP